VPTDVPERDDSTGRLVRTGKSASIKRKPTDDEYRDMWFGWMVEAGVISNSVLTAKGLATVSIAAGGQDRVSISKLAVAKAYESRRALFAIQRHGMLYDALALEVKEGKKPKTLLDEINRDVERINGGLKGAVAVSDAFFPYRDGSDALLDQGITAIIQPGDALRDYDVILACNERGATMVFTGQRSFRH
jgi:phosphoribosylaminoimidazolecarboxamide formyltransferase / IMP cyclohydrolase